MTQWLIAQGTALRWWIGLAKQGSSVFVRYLAPKMTYEDGKQCFLYLQPPTVSQTVGAVRGWEN